MNPDQQLDYALKQLDGPALDAYERWAASDPAAARSAERLTLAVRRLLDDGLDDAPPPADLARRTVAFVAESARRRASILDFVPVSVPFRWADVAVAAGILCAGLLTLLPAVQKSRERMDQAGCGYNLQQLGRALWQYGSRHQHYPFCPEQNPDAPSGAYVALLHDGGQLADADLDALNCPCAEGVVRRHSPLPDFKTLCQMHKADPRQACEVIDTDYAYNPGYHHPRHGKVVAIEAVQSATVALLADQPPHENFRTRSVGNSPNHDGRGQNVLYSDLHVGWHNTRRLGPQDDDMFLNKNYEVRPGLDRNDTALLPSMVPALGW